MVPGETFPPFLRQDQRKKADIKEGHQSGGGDDMSSQSIRHMTSEQLLLLKTILLVMACSRRSTN